MQTQKIRKVEKKQFKVMHFLWASDAVDSGKWDTICELEQNC